MLNRSVLGPQARRSLVQLAIADKAGENLIEDGTIDMNVSDVPADIFVSRIAQELQFGAVGAEDSAIGRHEMKADRPILEKVLKLVLVRAEGGCWSGLCTIPAAGSIRRSPPWLSRSWDLFDTHCYHSSRAHTGPRRRINFLECRKPYPNRLKRAWLIKVPGRGPEK
jgi:hypothetical protein